MKKLCFGVLFAACAAVLVGAPPALATPQDKKDDKAKDDKPKDAKDEKEKPVLPVALLAFEERGSGAKDLGAKVGDLLFAKLVAKPEFFLVDRADLKKILDEQSLSLTGSVKADEAVKVGQLTGAKLLVTGSVVQVDKQVHLVAKVISSETGRVTGTSVEGALTDDLGALAGKLADAIDETVAKQGEKLVPKAVPLVDRVAELNKKLGAGVRPVVAIQITEKHIGQPAVDPAAQTEVTKLAKDLKFEVIDLDEGGKSKADVLITGEGFSEVAGRVGGMISVRARVELKAVDRKTGKVIATDRQTVMVVDLSEQVAGKAALQNAAELLAERVLPKLVAPEKKK
jgi:TolB-like protein